MKTIEVDRDFILELYKPIAQTAHKGTRGHSLIIGGSYGKIGAVCLSSKAALVAGCGLATALLPECGYTILQTYCPEVMVLASGENHIANMEFTIIPDAIGIGPGMGQEHQTQLAMKHFLTANKTPLVIDADALNIFSQNKDWLSLLASKSILTPHAKEFERLVGKWNSNEDRISMAKSFSEKYNVILVLKGAPTIVIYKDQIFKNSTGNAALATAGSGDVLTGIITSLLAQKYEPLAAAIFGVYLHGKTADVAISESSAESFIASDIIKNLGKAYRTLADSQL